MFWESEISQVCLPQREAKEGSTSTGAFQHLQSYSDPISQMVKLGFTKDRGSTRGGPVTPRQSHDWKISLSSEFSCPEAAAPLP